MYIVFYSRHPRDPYSAPLLNLLDSSPFADTVRVRVTILHREGSPNERVEQGCTGAL